MEHLSLPLRHGLTVAAKSWGSHHGRKLLALHGWLDNAASFDGLAPELAKHYHVVAVDLPGHGQSSHRDKSADYLFVEWLHDVDCIIEALGWTSWTQLGHSMGAGISVCFAGTFPEKIEALIMLEGIGPLTSSAEETPKLIARGIASRQKLVDKPQRVVNSLEEGVERMLKVRMPLSHQSAMKIAERGTNKTDEGYVFSHDTRLHGTSMLRLNEAQVNALMSAIQCPTLLVRARDGWPAPDDVIKRRLDALSHVLQIEHVDGGHHMHMDDPQGTLDVVLPFLSTCRGEQP